MKLTVDASIVVKWFVDEPLSEESRLLLADRLDLHAPGVLLSEFANTIWKKHRRGETTDAEPFFDELAAIPEIVNLLPDANLVERAARVAVDIGHPVYDYLYLAGAEATNSTVITADGPLAKIAARRIPDIEVRFIGALGVADRIKMAATALTISRDQLDVSPISRFDSLALWGLRTGKMAATALTISRDQLAELIAAFGTFAATHKHVVDDLRDENEGLLILTHKDQDLYLDTPAYRRLLRLVAQLNEEERIDLLALGWFGAELFNDWARSLEHAAKTIATASPDYVAGYGHQWQTGYERLTRVSTRPDKPYAQA